MPEFLCQQEVELLGKKYVIYCKEVATKLAEGGGVKATAVRAFIRRLK